MNLKKCIGSLLTLCYTTTLSIGVLPTYAATETRTLNSEASAHELSEVHDILGASVFVVPARAIFKEDFDSNSKYRGAYCIERVKPSPTGQVYTKSDYMDDGYYTIIKNGYPYNSSLEMGMNNDTDAMYVTQLAIWAYQENWDISKVVMYNPDMGVKFEELIAKARNTDLTQDFTIELSSPDVSFEQSGDKMIAGPFAVSNENITRGTYDVNITSSQDGVTIKSEKGEEKSTFDKNEKFYIEAPVTTPTGEIEFEIETNFYRERAIKYLAPVDTIQDVVTLEEEPELMLLNGSAPIVQPSGTVNIIKKDEKTGAPLQGATFEIKDSSNNTLNTHITDSNGTIQLELPVGDYYYQEISSPTGYVLDDEEYPFSLSTNGEIKNIDVTNKKITGTLQLTKKDIATGDLLPNTEFIIRDENKNEVAKGITDENGTASFTLEYGKYTYQEFNAPEGYVLDESEFPFEVTEDGKIVKAEMTNRRISGELVITKTDVATGELLPNAEFIIRDEHRNEVAKGVTDENGIASFTLDYGKYTYQEFNAPIGYIIDESEFPFEIKQDGQIIKADMRNKQIVGSLEIKKVDASTNEMLPGAVFSIFAKNGKEIAQVTTDKNGIAFLENLPFGEYVINEVSAPEGYRLSSMPTGVNIVEDGWTVSVSISNEKVEVFTEPLPDTSGSNLLIVALSLTSLVAGVILYSLNRNSTKK